MDDTRQPVAEAPSAGAGRPASNRTDDLVRLWSVTIPRRIESWAPRLADAFADGVWTAIWPPATAYAPVAALIVGFAVAMLLAIPLDGDQHVWSELRPFMMLAIACGIAQGTAGIGLLAGYVLGDVLRLLVSGVAGGWRGWYILDPNPGVAILMVAGSALITYLLLAIPAVTLPMIARGFAERATLRWISYGPARMAVRLGAYVLAAGLLTYFWTRAVVVLIRPLFTWRSGSPTVEAISPVQVHWESLVGTAVLAVLVRVLLQELVVRRSSGAKRIAGLQEARWANANPGEFWRGVGVVPLIALVAGTTTLLLAGAYEARTDGVLVFVIAALLAAWRVGIIRPPAGWALTVQRIPGPGRLVVAGIVGYGLARIVVDLFWATNSLRPVLVGTLLVGVVFAALFPAAAPAWRRRRTADAA